MKRLLLGVLGGLTLLSAGCYTPAYSPDERHAMIFRNADYDGKQATDDFDMATMLQPASRLTIWNVR